jgi:hypothetical protein
VTSNGNDEGFTTAFRSVAAFDMLSCPENSIASRRGFALAIALLNCLLSMASS